MSLKKKLFFMNSLKLDLLHFLRYSVSRLPHFVMLSVNVLAIVGSIMTFNWAKLIYPECGSKIMLIGVLITLYSIGFACVLILIYSRLNPDTYTCISIRKTHFLKSNWFQWIYVDLGICFIVKYTYRNIHNDCTIKK